MLGIHARNILWGMTKCPRVDDTSKTSNQGHSKVKEVHFRIRITIQVSLNCYKCYLNQSNYY